MTNATTSLQKYLKNNSSKIEGMSHRPIIIRWLQSPGMKKSIEIIDKKVEYLINKQCGGKSKLQQWFLSDDRDFVNITAERYIIDYLKSKNNLKDNLVKNGVDALINNKKEKVGIEVTTLNGFFSRWIFTERLMELLDNNKSINDKTLNITYCHERIIEENKNNNIYKYIESINKAIMDNDNISLNDLGVSIEIKNRGSGCVIWEHRKADDYPWFKYLTCDFAMCKH